jgi:hypothetical protein
MAPDHEQQRVAWQKRHHHNTGLDKNDQKQQRINPGTIVLHKHFQVLVDVQYKIQQGHQNIHGVGLSPGQTMHCIAYGLAAKSLTNLYGVP